MEPWTLIESRTEPAGFVTVRAVHYRLANGSECEWDIIVAEDSVAVLALTEDHQVVLARQFRLVPQLILDELPGGGVESGGHRPRPRHESWPKRPATPETSRSSVLPG